MTDHERRGPAAEGAGGGRTMKIAMAICCAVMLAPLGLALASGAALEEGGLLALAAPLALCLGAHLVMHRLMGRSCHGSEAEGRAPATARVPAAEATRPERGIGTE